jgi:hypothetical protein
MVVAVSSKKAVALGSKTPAATETEVETSYLFRGQPAQPGTQRQLRQLEQLRARRSLTAAEE